MENGRLEKQIRLPLDELKLAFAASCVEGLARKTGKPYIEVYERMSRVGAIENYIKRGFLGIVALISTMSKNSIVPSFRGI